MHLASITLFLLHLNYIKKTIAKVSQNLTFIIPNTGGIKC